MTTPNPRPSFPTEEKHFHPFAALRFLRKTLAVYLIPLVNVLFERNWPAFWTALRQDAILFALLCGVSWVILRFSSWQLDEAGVLHLRWKLLFKLDTTIRGEALAALTLERPALFRLGGDKDPPLPRRAAAEACDPPLPAPGRRPGAGGPPAPH